MSKAFYPKLAAQNCVKNGKFFFPYLLTIICTSAAFYINLAIAKTPDTPEMERYSYLSAYMMFGTVILGLFSLVFVIYTNSFLMKRRSKELGLYNVLGMGKKNIGLVLSFETLYTWVLGVGLGISLGMLTQRLFTMLAQKLMCADVVYHYYVSAPAAAVTAGYFALVLGLTLLINLRRVHLQNPVELLRGGNVGEREPKTRWLLTVLGLLTLFGGYYIAVSTSDALSALAMYFVAVFLVIIGTYCLFTAVSIAVLKLLRKNKKFYYKTGNFIGLSGMLHRMNRNAVGLANICILSTMVLVMISATLSLYVGTEDSLNTRYPGQINVSVLYSAGEPFDTEKAEEKLSAATARQGLGVTDILSYSTVELHMFNSGGSYTDAYNEENLGSCIVIFFTAADYNKITGESIQLKKTQAMKVGGIARTDTVSFNFRQSDSGELRGLNYELLQGDTDFDTGEYGVYSSRVEYFVLPDSQALQELGELSRWGGLSSGYLDWICRIDTDGTPEEQVACTALLNDTEYAGFENDASIRWERYIVTGREANRQDFYSTNGGFFFLGIFLGFIFIMAMVLIMYYKQIAEGYEDRERFAIMQQVGLPKSEIRRSINVQVLVVFFAPLVVAGVHVLFDFYLVRMLLMLFGMFNWKLAAWCTAATFGVFTLMYAAVYGLTAKTYYNIVSEKSADRQ